MADATAPKPALSANLEAALARLRSHREPLTATDTASIAAPAAQQFAAAGTPAITDPDIERGRALSYPEQIVAAIYADKRLRAQEGGIKRAFDAVEEAGAKHDALGPEIAGRMGLHDAHSWRDRIVRSVGAALKPIGSAVNVLGSQLDRPGNALFGGAEAVQQGGSFLQGARDAASYGAVETDNPLDRLDRILDRAGWRDGPNYGPPILRALAFGASLGTTEFLPDTPIDWEKIAPRITGRRAMAFLGTMALDPISWVGIGPSSKAAAVTAGATKRFLNPTGMAARDVIRAAKFLTHPGAQEWFAQRGAQGVMHALESAATHLTMLERDTATAALNPDVRRSILNAYKMANEVVGEAISKEGVPEWLGKAVAVEGGSPLVTYTADRMADLMLERTLEASDAGAVKIAGLRRAIAARDVPKLQSMLELGDDIRDFPALAGKAQDAIAKAAKTLVKWEDPGGLKFADMTLVPGKPIRAAARQVGRVAAAVTPKPLRDGTEAMLNAMGKALSTTYKLPANFVTDLRERYIGPMTAIGTHARALEDEIFRYTAPNGVRHMATADEAVAITRAVDSGAVDTLPPHLQEIADKMRLAHDAIMEEEIARGMLDRKAAEDLADTYIYHYIKNPEVLEKIEAARTGKPRIKGFRDPSTYQRYFRTIAEGEAQGLKYEQDARKLFTMRYINAHKAMVKHDFFAAAKEIFALRPTDESLRVMARKNRVGNIKKGNEFIERINSVLTPERRAYFRQSTGAIAEAADVGDLTAPFKMQDVLRLDPQPLGDPADWPAIASRMVADGKTSVELLKNSPEGFQREFMRQRFLKAYARKGTGTGNEVAAIKAKYKDFAAMFPKGDANDILGDALGLPRNPRGDGVYKMVTLPGHGDYVFPERIADKMLEIDNRDLFSPAGQPVRTLLQAYERVILNRWRPLQTQFFPSFHVRNLVTSQMQTGADVGLAVLNPATRADAAAVLRGAKNYIIDIKGGTKVSAEAVRREYVNLGLFNTFEHRINVGGASATERMANSIVRQNEGVAAHPLEAGSMLGTFIENKVRMLHYTILRKDGLSPTDAARRVLKFQFDYANGLTPTEQQFVRTVVPFWSWAKNNTLLQAELAVTKPIVLQGWRRVADALSDDRNAPERPIVERQLMPDWLRNEFGIRVKGADVEHMSRYLMAVDMPQSDLNGLWEGDLGRTLAHWRDQIGPVPDLWEGLMRSYGVLSGTPPTDKDFAKAQEVLWPLRGTRVGALMGLRERFDPRTGRNVLEADKGKVKFFISAMMFDRVMREAGRLTGQGDSIWAGMAQVLTGAHYTDFDPAVEQGRRIDSAFDSVAAAAQEENDAADLALIERGAGGGANPLGPVGPFAGAPTRVPQTPGSDQPDRRKPTAP